MDKIILNILVGGLSALVQTSANDVHVLMPRVDRECLDEGFMPAHEAFLGYVCADWECRKSSKNCQARESTADNGEKLCWLRLDEKVVKFSRYRAYKSEYPEATLRSFLPPGLPDSANLEAVNWVPVLDDLDDEYPSIDRTLLEDDPGELLQAYASFEYTSRSPCGFAPPAVPTGGGANREARVGEYVFKKPGEMSLFKHRQALASGIVYRVETNQPRNANDFDLEILPFGGGAPWATLRFKGENASSKEVPLALVQLIPDWDAVCWEKCKKPMGGHLHVLYRMTDELPPPGEEVAGFFPTGRERDLSWCDIKKACQGSPFLIYETRAYADYVSAVDCAIHCNCGPDDATRHYEPRVIPSPGYNSPDGYREINKSDGPPLCTPLRAEMPSLAE